MSSPLNSGSKPSELCRPGDFACGRICAYAGYYDPQKKAPGYAIWGKTSEILKFMQKNSLSPCSHILYTDNGRYAKIVISPRLGPYLSQQILKFNGTLEGAYFP